MECVRCGQQRDSGILAEYLVAKATEAADGVREETNQYGNESRRHAHVYVFAFLVHQDQATLNPLDVSQWEFYVVPTVVLDQRRRNQDSITLLSLRKLHGEPLSYFELERAIGEAAVVQSTAREAEKEPGE